MGPDAMILVFWMLFKPTYSLSSFIKRLFSSSSLSAVSVVSSAYLRLLIFLPAILIPACASSSLAFRMMYSVCKLNKQGDNLQPWRTPFLIWNQSVVPCPVLNLHTDFSVTLAVTVVKSKMYSYHSSMVPLRFISYLHLGNITQQQRVQPLEMNCWLSLDLVTFRWF